LQISRSVTPPPVLGGGSGGGQNEVQFQVSF
jgi:hypothetical protein